MTLRLALTPGEPAGVGPDITIQSIQHGSDHELVAFADPNMLLSRAKQLGLPLTLRETSVKPLRKNKPPRVTIKEGKPDLTTMVPCIQPKKSVKHKVINIATIGVTLDK